MGRYYAMDRDTRWERTQRAYEQIVGDGNGAVAPDPGAYIESQYADDVTDEFLLPASIADGAAQLVHIENGDSVVFFNFRADRARQLSHALVDVEFTGFERSRVLEDLHFVTFTEYERDLAAEVAFPRQDVIHTLAEESLRRLAAVPRRRVPSGTPT